ESTVMQHQEMHGGNGFTASTVGDLGFEPTLGATSADAKPVHVWVNTIEVGEACPRQAFRQQGLQLRGGFGCWGFNRGREARPP
ncbi:MAG: hypothetical protein ACKPKO_46625, partial [Candidatus Fonsibacter sp.]